MEVKEIGLTKVFFLLKSQIPQKFKLNDWVRVTIGKDIVFITRLREFSRYANYICIPKDVCKKWNIKAYDVYPNGEVVMLEVK